MTTTNTPNFKELERMGSDIVGSPSKDPYSMTNESNISSDLSFLLNFLGDDKNRHTHHNHHKTKNLRKATFAASVQAYKAEFFQYMAPYRDESSFLASEDSDLADSRNRIDPDGETKSHSGEHSHHSYQKSLTMPAIAQPKDESIEKREKSKSKTWVSYSAKNVKPGEILKPSGFAKFKRTETISQIQSTNDIEHKEYKTLSAADISVMRNKKQKQELKEFLNFVEKNKKVSDSTLTSPNGTNLFTKFKISELREYIKTKDSILN